VDRENPTDTQAATELVAETLVEEVSIDGMCGVY
jgi:mycofactocin precursor